MSKCHVCGAGPFEKALFRQNKLGVVPAIWACSEHNAYPIDPLVSEMTDTIEGQKDNPDQLRGIEKVTSEHMKALLRMVTPMQQMIVRMHDVDLSRGRGVLKGQSRCLWTHDGHRITVSPITGGGLIVSLSKGPDPEAPPSTL